MAQGTLSPSPKLTILDANGHPVSGAKIYTYVAGTMGTTEPADTYADAQLDTLNANPVVCDTAGRAVIYLVPGLSYKFIVKTSADVLIWTQDDILAAPGSSKDLDTVGVFGESVLAGDAVYLSDGSGSLTPGLWYRGDADQTYSSTLPLVVGMAPAAVVALSSGTIRVAGAVTGLSGLTPGSTYYIDTAAGQITLTPPTNARVLGVAETTDTLIIASAQSTQSSDLDVLTVQIFS